MRRTSNCLLTCALLAQCLSGFGVLALRATPSNLRIATFNASLNRASEGRLISDLGNFNSVSIGRVAAIIQIVSPDIILINEFDFDDNGEALELFHENFLKVDQAGEGGMVFPYRFSASSNTGLPSGFDFDNNGSVTQNAGSNSYGNDSFGFGTFPGQFGMAIYSKYPILTDQVRTFQKFLWKDMPGALLPDRLQTSTPDDWYSAEELSLFRLSSKSHWDVPIDAGGRIVHVLASHPTPPVFDGAEDRNGKRNHDEIRFWADYIQPGASDYIYDDLGVTGGLTRSVRFAIVGDLNADPFDGDSVNAAANQLVQHERINTVLTPQSEGALEASEHQRGINTRHDGPPQFDTSDFNDSNPGNLRTDYVLPSKAGLVPTNAGVYWPVVGHPNANLISVSDHRLVYLDVEIVPMIDRAVMNLKIAVVAPETILFRWKAQPGVEYFVESSSNLLINSWSTKAAAEVDPDSLMGSAEVSQQAGEDEHYYRIAARFPPNPG